jgi:ABC-2 type transport system ATP-binding protein
MIAPSAAMRIQGLSKRFGTVMALDDVTFDLPTQSICGLLGPNGAGKTTLFSLAVDFLKPTAGRVEMLGVDAKRISELRGRVTILPQDAAFQRNVPVLEQLMFFRLLDGRTRAEAESEVERVLDQVGLADKSRRSVGTLSHGMVKRLGIAQAFLGQPEVVLLDEPTAGLDPQSARQIRDLVREMRDANTTIMISSHNLAEIQELCDHVAILDKGKLVSAGSVADITRAGQEFDLTLSRDLTEAELAELRAIRGVAGMAMQGSGKCSAKLDATDHDTDEILAALLRRLLEWGVTPRGLAEGRSLETHFLQLTGGEESTP